MSVKKVTIMVLTDANKSIRGVFDAKGKCVQGDANKLEAVMAEWQEQKRDAENDEEAAAELPATPSAPAATPAAGDVDAGFDDSDGKTERDSAA